MSGDDVEEPITPSHLMVGRRMLSMPDDLGHLCDLDDEEFSLNPKRATSRVKHLNNLLNHFWKRWRSEYLSCLREVHAQQAKNTHSDNSPQISVGDVVVIKDDGLPRGQWKIGMIQTLLKGRDGLIRAAMSRLHLVVANIQC